MAKQHKNTQPKKIATANYQTVKYLLVAFLSLTILIALAQTLFSNKFYPGVYLGDANLTFLTKDQSLRLVESKFNQRADEKITLGYQGQSFTIDLATSSVKVNFDESLDRAYIVGRMGDLKQQAQSQIQSLLFGHILTPKLTFNLDPQIEDISKKILKPPQNAVISFEGSAIATTSAQFKVKEGAAGTELDQQRLKDLIFDFLVFGKKSSILPVKIVPPKVTTADAEKVKEELENLRDEPIKLTFEDQSFTVDWPTIFNLLDLSGDKALLDQKGLSSYLAQAVASKINQPMVEPLFNFNREAKRVTAFKSAQEGRELDIDKTAFLILLALEGKNSKTIELPVNIIKPTIESPSEDFGIKDLLGRGVSHFAGSIQNRIYNINLAASKINGVLIKPGEQFSFVNLVGDISASSGYKQAYVIKEGRTVLDDGGGVCQVSTTVFRAALNSGVPITARTAHAYRVSYYEQGGFAPGLDATIWHPSVDLKFKNDTGNYILIQAYTSGTTLYVDLYGTSDGRATTVSKSVVTNQTPPPPEIRQDDPTLPRGTVKQVDWAAWGANVTFSRKVTRGGDETLINETYKSVYRPWQAVYLVGTQ